MTKFIRR